MMAFLKSDLFLRFAGGFALGAVAMFALAPEEQGSIAPSAYAAPASPSTVVDRAAG